MEVTGKIHFIGDTNVVSDKFSKRDVVLKIADNPQFVQYVSFQFTQEKCALLDLCEAGQDVTISFNLRGREWVSPQGESKYFNTLEGWRIQAATGITPVTTPANVPPARQMPTAQQVANVKVPNLEDLDDSSDPLPF